MFRLYLFFSVVVDFLCDGLEVVRARFVPRPPHFFDPGVVSNTIALDVSRIENSLVYIIIAFV